MSDATRGAPKLPLPPAQAFTKAATEFSNRIDAIENAMIGRPTTVYAAAFGGTIDGVELVIEWRKSEKGTWRFFVCDVDDTNKFVDTDEHGLRNRRMLASCPLEVKMRAVEGLPDLFDQIRVAEEGKIAALEEASEFLNNIVPLDGKAGA